MKKCKKCKLTFSLDSFYKMTTTYSTLCKECYKKRRRNYYKKNSLTELARSKRWNDKNPEKVAAYTKKSYEKRKLRYYTDPEYRALIKERNNRWQRKKYKADPIYKLKNNLKCRISCFIKQNTCQPDSAIRHIIGTEPDFARLELISKLKNSDPRDFGKAWGLRFPFEDISDPFEILSKADFKSLKVREY